MESSSAMHMIIIIIIDCCNKFDIEQNTARYFDNEFSENIFILGEKGTEHKRDSITFIWVDLFK